MPATTPHTQFQKTLETTNPLRTFTVFWFITPVDALVSNGAYTPRIGLTTANILIILKTIKETCTTTETVLVTL